MRRTRSLAAAALVAALACGEQPQRPPAPAPDPTLADVWPNDDGRSWSYAVVRRRWAEFGFERTYDTADAVPAMPPLVELERLARAHPIGDEPPTEVRLGYALRFRGALEVSVGRTAQNLAESLFTGPRAAATGSFRDRLHRARPDLVAGLAPAGAQAPLFLHGGAWERTAAYIGTPGEAPGTLAWKYLDADLAVGHEFTLQLVPQAAPDVFLHGRIVRRFDATVQGVPVRGAVECLYAVDYGVVRLVRENSSPAFARLFDYALVVYAPGIGPVASAMRGFVEPGPSLSAGQEDETVTLIETGR